MLLEVKEINTYYGISHILFSVSMEIKKKEGVCILGRNGVGKTTTLKSIMGISPPRSGSIRFNGIEIMRKKPFQIAKLGIGFAPENRIIFPDLTTKENLEIAKNRKAGGHWTNERVYNIFPILKTRENQMGGTLSGGEQQMLTIARALMGNPELLILDEASEGLSPLIRKELRAQLVHLKNEEIAILVCEQNASFVLPISNRAYILEKGEVRWTGEVSELKKRPEIMKTYLGV